MAKRKSGGSLGSWAFLVGVIIAIILGAFGSITQTWAIALLVIGLIVGLFNITEEETEPFLFSGAVLIIASAFGGSILSTVSFLGSIFDALLLLFVPATIIVAVKNVFQLARR